MSSHWNPDADLALLPEARARSRWPSGATAGVALVAVACVGMAVLLYKLAGPRDLIAP